MNRSAPLTARRLLAAAVLPLLVAGCDALTGGSDVPADAPPASRFASLYQDYLRHCASCHAPGAPGSTVDGIEKTLDFTTEETAWTTLTGGVATGLLGNQEACNGVPFVGATYGSSLLAAVLDDAVRGGFSVEGSSGPCDADTVSDQTLKVGFPPPAGFTSDLQAWIDAGAPR